MTFDRLVWATFGRVKLTALVSRPTSCQIVEIREENRSRHILKMDGKECNVYCRFALESEKNEENEDSFVY